MKKAYTNPELCVIALNEADVIATSVEMDLWSPTKDDRDWSSYIQIYQ